MLKFFRQVTATLISISVLTFFQQVPASKQQDFGAPPSKEEWGGDQQVFMSNLCNEAGHSHLKGPASDWANEATVDGAGGVPTGKLKTSQILQLVLE